MFTAKEQLIVSL